MAPRRRARNDCGPGPAFGICHGTAPCVVLFLQRTFSQTNGRRLTVFTK